MKSTLLAICVFIAITTFSLKGLGQGVTTPSFGPSAVTESFEGIPISSNNYTVGPGFSVPVTPFTFPSGIKLTEPDPNGQWNVNIVDGAGVPTGWNLCPSQVATATDAPDGVAFLAGYGPTLMTFTLPVAAEKVGVYVEGSTCTTSNTITLTAYNASNAVIGTTTTEATANASNWKNHFIGFNSATDGIAKITLTGPGLVIDKLTFEKQQECLTTPSFGPTAVTESFERINGSGVVNYQPVTPFTFGSGIILTGPNPNTGQVLIGDWSQGSSPRYLCNMKVFSATDVPDGTAYLSLFDKISTLTFTLPAPSGKVGMYVEGVAGTCVSSTTITLTAYNASDAVIGSCTTEATAINDGSNWKNHFLGFRSLSDGIAKITINGPYIMIDKLTFEPLPCVSKTWYLDADNDGYYTGSGVESCTAPGAGYKSTGLTAGNDCNDADPNVLGPVTLYRDVDHDGFGDINHSISICSAADIPSDYIYVTDSSDCDDTQMLFADMDGDGVAGLTRVACGGSPIGGLDCDDNNANIQSPIVYFADVDGDGYGNPHSPLAVCSTTPPIVNGTHYVSNGSDLNDNQVIYADNDGDGFGAGSPVIINGITDNSDCDDTKPSVHPGAVEICGNGIDDNCNGLVDENCGTCGNATGLTTTTITTTSATLNWVANLNPLQWQVQYKSTARHAKWIDITGITPSMRSVTINGLTSGQTYNWHIRAKCSKSWTSYSKAVGFTTSSSTQTIVQARPLQETGNVDETNSRLALYPNPSKGRFIINLHLLNNNSTKAKIELVNMLGQTVYTDNGNIANGKLQQTVSMPSLAAHGMYLVRVIANNKVYQQKLIYTK